MRALFFYKLAPMEDKHFLTELTTSRLFLRKFQIEDAVALSHLLRHREVPATTLMLPFPCELDEAQKLIKSYQEELEQKTVIRWAITSIDQNALMGGIRLVPTTRFNSAEMGFWIGKDFWRNGYTIEAAASVLQFAFDELQFNRINAHAMVENAASLKLLEKLGFKQEGIHPELVLKWDIYKDVITFGLLKKHYVSSSSNQ